jgi:rubredoxin
MERWECTVCGYIYDPELGDPTTNVSPGTSFSDLPEGWTCPDCGATPDLFEKI